MVPPAEAASVENCSLAAWAAHLPLVAAPLATDLRRCLLHEWLWLSTEK